MKHLLSYFKPHKQEKLPSGDFFVTIARKIIQYEYLYRKGA